ncbi:hypothetical protein OIU77_007061 [Salix suchowensis]|uniref:Uncharacterized protein n=1 Tax=Salix suchowensis TaxID=1278906 RepID=A0ABQ9AP99_9ROSI|nr:hypothetical protein OIU77_007061 [Salix suchowensis]
MVESLGLGVSGVGNESDGDGVGIDFNNFRVVQTACINFGKDRFDIFSEKVLEYASISSGSLPPELGNLKSLQELWLDRNRLQGSVPASSSSDFTSSAFGMYASNTNLTGLCRISKLKVVCSHCRLRSSCESGYLLTNKEDEARTIDLIRVLLANGFDSINGSESEADSEEESEEETEEESEEETDLKCQGCCWSLCKGLSFCTRTKLWREASSHVTFIACGPCLLSVIFPPAALGKVAVELENVVMRRAAAMLSSVFVIKYTNCY